MIKKIIFILLISNTVLADDNPLQAQLQNEYGNCYGKFEGNLQGCTPSSCTYPDLTNAQAWKANVINGLVGGKCYVMYYSYIGESITSDIYDCFYDDKQRSILASLYNKLFSSGSSMDILTLKERIEYLKYDNCKTRNNNSTSSTNGQTNSQPQTQ